MKHYDVIIVGAGPSGIFLRLRADETKSRYEGADDREGTVHREEAVSKT